MVIIQFWAIVCFFNATYGLKRWLPYPIISSPFVYDVDQKLSSQELKTDNNKESAEVLTKDKENYFTRLTPVENAGGKEVTKPTITDITYNYSNLVLTTAINEFRKEMFTSNLNIIQDNTIDFIKKTIRATKFPKKPHRVTERYQKSEDFFQDRDFTRSESHSRETTEENHYRVLTPARRIFRGHKTKIQHFPFLVTVHVLGRFVCGGTIIKSDLVITAAHCLKRWQEWIFRTTITPEATTNGTTTNETTTDTITTDIITTDTIKTDTDAITADTYADETGPILKDVETTTTTLDDNKIIIHSDESGKSSSYETYPPKTVVTEETSTPQTLGLLSVRIGTNYYRLEGKVVQVINVYFHPSYNEKNLQDNLVIMRLERDLKFKSKRVRKIEISTDAYAVSEGTEVTIAGWGAKTYHNKIFNALWNLIHKAVLTVSPQYECADTYTENYIRTTNFCALNENHEGACNGDAGNPAVVDGVLVGVVSFGPPNCGQWDAPTVFTNVGYYADWIQGIMDISLESSSSSPSLSSDETTSPEEATTETTTEPTTECAGWSGWTRKKTTTTTIPTDPTDATDPTVLTPVYYVDDINEDEQDLSKLLIFRRRKFENLKLRRKFRVEQIDDSEQHSTTMVPLDNTLPKISALSESGTTIERMFLLTPNRI
ncbi:uncharacterized protein LOC134674228 [Cydia fagiglandana]|uniref:uncharacterized protein LOC134674228 n=1 Tax=Cydia fagiglandana TaxID=1458189 RepID=UPI002FEE5EC1